MRLLFLVSGERNRRQSDLSCECVGCQEVVRLGSVISGLSEEALCLLVGDVVVGLDAEVHVFVGDIGGSLDALCGTASLPGVVKGKANVHLSEELGAELDGLSRGNFLGLSVESRVVLESQRSSILVDILGLVGDLVDALIVGELELVV